MRLALGPMRELGSSVLVFNGEPLSHRQTSFSRSMPGVFISRLELKLVSMTQIYVGNLPFSVSEPELLGMFGRYGRVSSVRMATDKSTGRPRGFAFVTMNRMEDADEAIVRLNGSHLAERAIVVNEARGAEGHKTSSSSSDNRNTAITRLNLL